MGGRYLGDKPGTSYIGILNADTLCVCHTMLRASDVPRWAWELSVLDAAYVENLEVIPNHRKCAYLLLSPCTCNSK